MNKYILFVNIDSILKEKYLDSYLKDGYVLLYSEDKSLAFRKGESSLDNKIELDYIKGSISMLKRLRIKNVIALDISEEMSKVTGKPHLDNLFWKRIKMKAMKKFIEII